MKRALLLAISLMLVTGVLVWALTNFQSAQCVLGQTNYTNNGANGTVGRSLGINYPGSVCSDGTRLFVADANNDRILIYNTIPTSNLARPDVVIGQTCLSDVETNQNDFVTLNNYLSDPQGVYCDGTRLYIADTGNNRVLIYNTVPTANNQAADTVVGHWGSSATSATMSSPYAVWGDGTRMVVADYGNNRVLVYNNIALLPVSNGTADHVIGQANMTASSANEGGACSQYSLYGPNGVSSDGTKLFVADQNNSRVLIYNALPTGADHVAADNVVGQANYTGNSPNQGGSVAAGTLYDPWSTWSDGTKLYIADYKNNRVLIYNTVPTTPGASANVAVGQGDLVSASNPGTSQTSLAAPSGCFAKSSKLFIADNSNCRVLIYNSIPTSSGASASVVVGQSDFVSGNVNLGATACTVSTLASPSGISTDGTRLVVTDIENSRVLIYNTLPTTNCTPVIVVGQANMVSNTPSAGGATGLYYPWSACIGGGNLFVADTLNHRVLVYNNVAGLPAAGASANRVIGQVNMANHSANAGGATSQSSLNGPAEVWSDGTRVLIADDYNNRVLVYNSFPASDGAAADAILGQTNGTNFGTGCSATTMNNPHGVWSDGTRIFVADFYNNRVLVFNSFPGNGSYARPADMVIGQANLNSGSTGYSASTMNCPVRVWASNGQLFVSDNGNSRVLVFNTIPTSSGASADLVLGHPDFTTRKPNDNVDTGPNNLYFPYGVCAAGNNVYVADENNNRVLGFLIVQPTPNPVVTAPSGSSYVYPQPARGDTAGVAVALKGPGTIKVLVYNEGGRLVDTLNGTGAAGTNSVQFSIKSFAPGVYFYIVRISYSDGSSETQSTKKFVVIK